MNASTIDINDVMQRRDVWRASSAPLSTPGLPTGFAELDAVLPGGGWPLKALTEISIPCAGIGELRLLLPALARLSRGDRWLAFVGPPYIPYAPALVAAGVDLSRVLMVHPRAGDDALWAVEQTLRAGTCAAVLAWPAVADTRSLRRLQLAAEAGDAWGVMFRQERVAATSSPAALRLRLAPRDAGLGVHILKRRGGWPVGPLTLEVSHAVAVSGSAGPAARGAQPRPATCA